MARQRNDMIAPCGLDCSACDIYRAQSEPETLKKIMDWLLNVRHIDLKPEQVACGGCLGDRAQHWSADCGLLKCAVDQRRLTSCSQCEDFPCGDLTSHAAQDPGYMAALERLTTMRKTGR